LNAAAAGEQRKGIAWTAVSAIAFGTLVSLAEVAKRGGVSTETMLFIRFLIATVVVGIWVSICRREELRSITTSKRLALLGMGGILYVIQSYCFFRGLDHAPGALISLLLYLYPAFVAVGSFFFFSERMTKTKIGALVLAMVGAGMAIGPATAGDPMGIVYGIGTALSYSVYILVGTRVVKDIDGLTGSVFVFGGAAVAYALMAGGTGFQMPATAASWAGCVGLALVSVIAMAGFLVGIKMIGPVNASTVSALEPIVTAILGVVIWSQSLAAIQWLGGVVIVGAVIWLIRSR
jgi:drug/metabolite transporter (DMT)-like permease